MPETQCQGWGAEVPRTLQALQISNVLSRCALSF